MIIKKYLLTASLYLSLTMAFPVLTIEKPIIPFTTSMSHIINNNMPQNFPELKKAMTYQYSWLSGNYTNFNQWKIETQQFFRQHLLVDNAVNDFNYEVLDQKDRGSYIAQKVKLNINDNNQIIGYLLLPKNASVDQKAPAAVIFHDHGAKFDIGKEKVIESWGDAQKLASSKAWVAKFLSNKFIGDELAKRGYIVFATDALGWSDRGPMVYEQQQALASNMFNLGTSLAGMVAYDDIRSVDFLASLPEVDHQRIATVGFSFGAYRSWQTAALSNKVSASISVSWFGNYQGLLQEGNNILRGQSSFYMLHPGVAKKLDIPDVASLSAPNAILIFNGEQDNLFPKTSVQDAYQKVHQIWRSQQAEGKVYTKLWPKLGHVFVEAQQQAAFDWLDKQFKLP